MAVVAILDDVDLHRRWRERGDHSAREELVARYLPRARTVARRFLTRREPLDDLEQVASIGLMKAVDRYDPGQGSAFWTYALPTVTGELKRHYRDHCWTVHVPRSVQERALNVQAAVGRLSAAQGRSPSVADIADELEMSREDVLEGLEAGSAYDPRSLDERLPGEGEGSVGDLLGADDDGIDHAERRAALAPALRALPERERMVLHLRFTEDLTQSEIAERLGISQMHVSRVIRAALERMRKAVGPASRKPEERPVRRRPPVAAISS